MRYREIPRNANNLPNFATRFNEFSFVMRHYIPKNANFPPLTMLQGIFLKSVLFFFRQILR